MVFVLLIALGGALGAVSRYVLNLGVDKLIPSNFPFGILLVNTLGAIAIGFLYLFSQESFLPSYIRPMLSVGFLGAFTTFSTYSLQSIELLRNGETILGILNIVLNNALALGGVLLGMLGAVLIKEWL